MAHEICTEDEIVTLVHTFYDRIRRDEMLGPIFNEQISNWPEHLDTMVRFWSSLLLGTASFSGRPMPKHAVIPGLTAELFHRWLTLFKQTSEELGNADMAERVQDFSRRIARQLWMGYQINNFEPHQVSDLFAQTSY